MEFGYFAMPSHPPERGLKAGHDWDLQTLRWLDELGYTEAWIGEHHTAPWEPHPGAGSADRPGAAADQAHPHRAGRLPAAVSPPGRTRQPRGDAGSSVRGAAEFRRRRVGAGQRLGDVPGRRQFRRASRDDARSRSTSSCGCGATRRNSNTTASSGRWRSRPSSSASCARTSIRCRSRIRRSAWRASRSSPTR